MKTIFLSGLFVLSSMMLLLSSTAFAQRNVSIAGVIESEEALLDNTRVGVHVINSSGGTISEVASVAPVAGTFSVTTQFLEPGALQPFQSGIVPLPGLQSDYTVSPAGVNFARAVTKVYVDSNNSGGFDASDEGYLGVVRTNNPAGFFVLLYVDQNANLRGGGVDLSLQTGWNVFTVRFPESGNAVYAIEANLTDVVLDVFLP